MNQIERILEECCRTHLHTSGVKTAQQQTALEFTKWKDEKYTKQIDDLYYERFSNIGKTLSQLFEEWNNLNN